MNKYFKTIFLPADERIFTLFKGYVLDDKMVKGVKESDIYTKRSFYDYNSGTFTIHGIVIGILFAIVIVVVVLIAHIFKKSDKAMETLDTWARQHLPIKRVKNEPKYIVKTLKEKYEDAEEEDVVGFLEHCKKHQTRVYLYGFNKLNELEEQQLDYLIKANLVVGYQQIKHLSNLATFIQIEAIAQHNSMIVVKRKHEIKEATSIGYFANSIGKNERSVFLWQKHRKQLGEGKNEAEMNSRETLISLRHFIDNSVYAVNNYSLANNVLLYVEDEFDEKLNEFISKNLERFNKTLAEKRMVFFYYPAIRESDFENNPLAIAFIKSCIPPFLNITDEELKILLHKTFKNLSPERFYHSIVDSLKIPHSDKPYLIRSIYDGSTLTTNKLKVYPIEYHSNEDLEEFFDTLITSIEIPDENKHGLFSRKKPPTIYDTNWHFKAQLSEDSIELKAKIDAIKAKGEFGLLAEAMMYLMETLKNEHPTILNKVKPLIENRQLLESNVPLSAILIDKNFNIFLTDYGNTEVKMHTLSKTVFLLFLRYPDGIKFKELVNYKLELLEIYNKLTNRSEQEDINKTIDDLVDPTNPSINQKCARIREAFRNIMEEHLAKSYYIDGNNSEPKKISLPRSLVKFNN